MVKPYPCNMAASRRHLLRAAAAGALLAACERAVPSSSMSPTPTAYATSTATPTPTIAAAASPRPVLIRAAAIADGTSATPRPDVVVILRGDRIAYAGARDGAPEARDADVVDLPALTIVPAMVDCHAHLTGTGGANAHARLQDPDAVLLARATENARILARSGVLAVRDLGAVRQMNVRARDALRSLPDMPTIVAAGTWIARRGRYVTFAIEVDSADELRAAAMVQLDAGADLVKIAVDGATGSAATFTVSELRATVDAVHARGKTIAVHSQGRGSRVAAEAGVDSIEHGFVIDATTAAAMRGRTVLVTTLSVAQAFGELGIATPSLRAAHDAGVRIAVGTDAGGAPPQFGSFANEVELLVRAGLAPHEALASATRVGGEVMGLSGFGTLDAGAPADFVAVDGDPLADPAALRRVRTAFRSGRRIA